MLDSSDKPKPLLIGPDDDGVPTLWDSFLKGYSLAGGSSNCMGTRLSWEYSSHQSDKPSSEYQWLSYAQVWSKIRALSIGLTQIFGSSSTDHPNLSSYESCQGLKQPRLALWCSSSPFWTISEYAAYRNSMTVISINNHLPVKSSAQIIENTKPRAIVLNTHNFNRLIAYRNRLKSHQTSRPNYINIQFKPSSSSGAVDVGSLGEGSGSFGSPNSAALDAKSNKSPANAKKILNSHQHPDRPPSVSSSAYQNLGSDLLLPDPIYIITDPLQLSNELREHAIKHGLSFYSYEEVEMMGHDQLQMSLLDQPPEQSFEVDKVLEFEKTNILRPNSNTFAAIIYSSGTTGNPKPCVLTHGNFAANLAAFNNLTQKQQLKHLSPQDLVQFSYLPLYHIYEKLAQAYVLNSGGSIGFCSLQSPRFLEDLSVLKPTFLSTTPDFLTNQILDRRLQFLNNFSSFKNPIESYLLNKAIDQKIKMLKSGFGESIWLWDRFVLGYLRDLLGGRLKCILSGTSPLSKHVAELLSASLSVKIIEGYGLTETCGAATITIEEGTDGFQVGHVGPPLPCCEVKLERVDGIRYLSHSEVQHGRVYIRGPNVFSGYLVPRTLTTEEHIQSMVDSEGWLATGDIGYFDDRGRLHLVDRILSLDKLNEYILPQQLHNQFNFLDLRKIEQVFLDTVQEITQIFISGRIESTHAEVGIGQIGNLVGFIVVDRLSFSKWATDQNQTNNQTLARRSRDSFHGHEDEEQLRFGAFITDKEWEMIDDERNSEVVDDHNSIHRSLSLSQTVIDGVSPGLEDLKLEKKADDQIEFAKMCKEPQLVQSFLSYLRHRGKTAGLKLHEMPTKIYLNPDRFDEIDEQDQEKANEEEEEVESQRLAGHMIFSTLNSKKARLIQHFCS